MLHHVHKTYWKHQKMPKKNTQTIEKGNKKIEINQDDSTFYREIQENRYVVRRNFNVFFLSAGFIRSDFFFFFDRQMQRCVNNNRGTK